MELSEKAIKRWLWWNAVQHPVTLLPLVLAVASAGCLLLLAGDTGSEVWATMLLGISVAAAAGSFFWWQLFRYPQRYRRRVQDLKNAQDRERTRRGVAEVGRLRQAIEGGFSAIGSSEGLKALTELVWEYEELQPSLGRQEDSGPLSISFVPSLAEETYRRGLSVLSDALDLMRTSRTPDKERLEREISALEEEVEALTGNRGRADRLKIREDTLASHRQRLGMLGQLQEHIDQLLSQAGRCEASLHRSRIELAAIRTGSSETRVSSVIEVLRDTLLRAKEVQDELRSLGY